MPAKIIYHPFGVEVFTESGGFAGGITRERMQRGPEDVAVALQCLLRGFGVDAELKADVEALK